MPERIIASGSHTWNDTRRIYEALSRFPRGTVLIHGVSPGADQQAAKVGRDLDFKIEPYPYPWDQFRERNQEMIDEGKPDRCIVFHNDISASVGTRDLINRAINAGISVTIVTDSDMYLWGGL